MIDNLDRPNVFVTQIPNRKDPVTGAYTPTVNIGPASEFGNVVMLMPARTSFFATSDLVSQLRTALKDYNYERGDSLVALGDPAIIAVACSILGKDFGKFILLKWDKNISRYAPSHIRV